MKDIDGYEYVKLNGLRPGDYVQVDDGFTCIKPWSTRKVLAAPSGELGIRCGGPFEEHETQSAPQVHFHGLKGQLSKDGSLIGVYKPTTRKQRVSK